MTPRRFFLEATVASAIAVAVIVGLWATLYALGRETVHPANPPSHPVLAEHAP